MRGRLDSSSKSSAFAAARAEKAAARPRGTFPVRSLLARLAVASCTRWSHRHRAVARIRFSDDYGGIQCGFWKTHVSLAFLFSREREREEEEEGIFTQKQKGGSKGLLFSLGYVSRVLPKIALKLFPKKVPPALLKRGGESTIKYNANSRVFFQHETSIKKDSSSFLVVNCGRRSSLFSLLSSPKRRLLDFEIRFERTQEQEQQEQQQTPCGAR